ncbi:exonuclease SbcCD subunit D [Nesterenkonia flava]|uniref:Nuclease SbcCD subunit D n=1 Tax=Nesterenkonia flava TaxID=469799 RepID=A0ABU1FTH3_9MICC|nr:exonuclease SbcCD subunit D [Nesterenkonia flava]MDR5711446.1 exonuclease SbcCD subunit D [Nesterenkonia flava]
MRILHTSDWHLGRGFHGYALRAEQEQMLDTVCAAVQEHGVDAVLISGDIYDRAFPPEWAVQALEDALLRLVELGSNVIITSGNHDSAARLGFARGLMSASGVHIRSALEDAWTPVELAEGDERVLVYGVPYLEPQLYAAQLGCARAHHTAVMNEVLGRVRADLRQRREVGEHIDRVLLMAHVFAASGVATDSERNIGVEARAGDVPEHHEETIGGLSVVPLELFGGFDYVALGHLHGRQRLSPTVRYSGSPVTYSFSEADQAKGAWLLDTRPAQDPAENGAERAELVRTEAVDEDVPIAITPLGWRIGRQVKKLQGTIEEILSPETVEAWSDAYVQIKLTDPERPERAHQRVREAYPYLATFSYEGEGRVRSSSTYSAKVEGAASDAEIIAGFLAHVRDRGPSDQERRVIEETLEAVRIR